MFQKAIYHKFQHLTILFYQDREIVKRNVKTIQVSLMK